MSYLDLLKDFSRPDPFDKNYFIVTITDLNVDEVYPIQFKWKFKDGTSSKNWSAVKEIVVPEETVNTPSTPSTDVGFGYVIVVWDGNDSNGFPMLDIDRINVMVNGNYYGSIFKSGSAGRLSLVLPKGTHLITFIAVSKLGTESNPSAAATVIVSYSLEDARNELDDKLEASGAVIANAQNQITSINTNGVTVFASSGTSSSGNRITMNAEGIAGWPSGSSNNNPSFAIRINEWTHSDGQVIPAGSAFFNGEIYAQSGKFVGNLTVSGQMKLGVNAGGSGNHGIYITDNNYWYAGGNFKVGTSNKYMQWDSTNLKIVGDMYFGNDSNSDGTPDDFINTTGDFRFGSGVLNGNPSVVKLGGSSISPILEATSSQISIGLQDEMVVNSSGIALNGGRVTLQSTDIVESDNNNFAGDPTLTLNDSNQITKGRRFIFDGTITGAALPTNPGSGFTYRGRSVKTGDILMIRET